MMKTRRKSKMEVASTADVEPDTGAPSESQAISLTIPEDIDLDALFELLPDTSLASPTPENIVALYRLLLAQSADLDATQRQLDEANAESEKKDVELDQALQDRESLSKDLEGSITSLNEELNQVKRERDELAEAKNSLQNQIATLANSQSSSSSEVVSLKQRVDDTEREKRDLIGVISQLKQEAAQREEEVQSLRANLKAARQEHQALEGQVRELRSTETSTKFKIESLEQQLQLSQGESERLNAELTSKTEEFSKFRKAKHAELTNVQASHDALSQSLHSTQSSLKALQSAHSAQTHQLTQALTKVQGLSGQLAEQEAKYSSEANGLRRLVSMMEEREKQAKEVVDSIEREWAGIGEKAERKESVLRDEIEREKRGREAAEKRLGQLEIVMERMGRGELPMPGRGSAPGTPMRGADLTMDGMMGLSPTIAMASKAQRSGKTFTEVYADYVRLQDDYSRKCAEYDHMDRTLSAVLAQIEERAPILSQQRADYERLQLEASQLATQLSHALSERDSQSNLYREATQKLSKSATENNLLQKQLEDLGRQVQSLLREIAKRDDPTIPSDEDLENSPVAPAEDTDSLITNNLVLFKSIGGLQEQNQKLLKIVRELGRKMESEEKDYRTAMEQEQGEAVREAHETIQELAAQLERQKKSSESIIQSYVKERDALRGMLARAERAAGTSLARDIGNGGELTTGDQTELAKELAEVQSQYEAFRNEMGVDTGRLRDDLITAQREANQLGAALAKANAKIEFLSDRHRMHQEQFALHGREIDDLTKRNQQLYDQWTRIDIECSRVTEDLQIANGRVEQLRSECANLRAEKQIWESVQGRLVEENKSLTIERSRLSDLMTNVQRMHNDLERSGENDRRRLETQLQTLEAQTLDLRAQVSQERDTVRHLSLQKDIELKELQTRLDKTVEELSKTRESLVGAETSKKHLEERVEDLTRQLRGNEEKLSVYERRSTTVGSVAAPDSGLSQEQQLETEVAELRSALKVAEVDLATARNHVQQFQEISRASESALASLNATHDEYKASTEAQITRHESDLKAAQEKLQSAQEDLLKQTAQFNEIQKTIEAERMAWTLDKKTLEDTIVDMSTSEKNLESDRASREQETRQLEDRAKAAEDRYSHEVVAHAESIKSIENLKKELNIAQVTARDHRTAAETAQAKLATSEESWRQQKEALDKEISTLNARCNDLNSQNSILHQHLESVSAQAARIRQVADSDTASTTHTVDGEASEDPDTKLSELRSVVSYLRKEKEIVDLQLEMSKQENIHLKTQLERLAQNLQETRNTLAEERERAIESAASTAQHAELVERINQMNILRESNATLRAECESHARKSKDLELKLKQLSAQLDPAKEEAAVAKAELETSKAQLVRLEQESRRWQERNAQLLTKYDRIDPAEVQALKDEIESLKAKLAEAEQNKTEQEQAAASHADEAARIVALEENLRRHKESFSKNSQFFRSKMVEFNTFKSAALEEKKQHETKIASLELEIKNLQAAKATFEQEKANLGKTAESSEDATKQAALLAALQEERDKLLAEKASWTKLAGDVVAPNEESRRAWENEKAELLKTRDEALEKLKTATEEIQKANEDIKGMRTQNSRFQLRITELNKLRNTDSERAAAQQQAAIQAAVEQTRVDMQAPASSTDDIAKEHANELKALEEKLTAKHQAELKAAVDTAVEAALKNKPAADPDSDSGSKANIDAAIAAAIEEHEKKLQSQHTEEIAHAVERGRMEQVAKGKLKDSQLVKAQKKVKELEAQILEWRSAGLLPEASAGNALAPAAPANQPPTPTTANPQAPATTTPQASNQATPQTPSKAPTVALPRRPTLGAVGTPTAPRIGVGRGAGIGRGGPPIRGTGAAHSGGAPGRSIPATQAPAAAGVSIIGAAAKRPRDESNIPADDSLAKRLKPAVDPAVNKPPMARRPGANPTGTNPGPAGAAS